MSLLRAPSLLRAAALNLIGCNLGVPLDMRLELCALPRLRLAVRLKSLVSVRER
jgi:hypothetical protein